MARFFWALILLGGVSLFVSAPPARAFGCEAHQMIALIAESHLTPHAQEMVRQLLKDIPIDPALVRFCQQANLDPMAYSSTWADDYRTEHHETAPWHQIDIPISVSGGDLADYCPPTQVCLPQALRDQIAVLRAGGPDSQKRTDALRFVIHFLGDLHQPLHTADNNDLGGNCVPVTFFGEAPHVTNAQNESYTFNLHQLWDYGILQHAFQNLIVQRLAVELDRKYASQEAKWMREPVDIDAWTWESFHLAKDVAYGKLPVPIPVEGPVRNNSCAGDNHIAERMLKLNEQIGQTYQDVAAPVVEQQIAKAGARLAMLLNQLWP